VGTSHARTVRLPTSRRAERRPRCMRALSLLHRSKHRLHSRTDRVDETQGARLVGCAEILHHWRNEMGAPARRERATGHFWPIVWQPVLHRPEQKCRLFGCLDTTLHLCCSATTHVFDCHFGDPSKCFCSPHSNMVTLPSHNGIENS
jgi:hypothetical protein